MPEFRIVLPRCNLRNLWIALLATLCGCAGIPLDLLRGLNAIFLEELDSSPAIRTRPNSHVIRVDTTT